jgi:uncharacterized cofD-like protein
MADDGGSSGMLREHTGKVPPGDVRKCLTAMAASAEDPWVRAFSRRFSYLNYHTLGNLMLTALEDAAGSFPAAIALCEQLLHARGHVYPSTLKSVTLTGVTRDGQRLEGQSAVSHSKTALNRVFMQPADPEPYEPALAALREADLIVLGPGSLFTSVIPNLLVPGIIPAIAESHALVVYVCNLGDMQGETWGLNAAELVEALFAHGMRGKVSAVVAHRTQDGQATGQLTGIFRAVDPQTASVVLSGGREAGPEIRRVLLNSSIALQIEQMGPTLVARDLADPLRPTWHSVPALAEALRGVFAACRLPQR